MATIDQLTSPWLCLFRKLETVAESAGAFQSMVGGVMDISRRHGAKSGSQAAPLVTLS